jgi:hypothetical protein
MRVDFHSYRLLPDGSFEDTVTGCVRLDLSGRAVMDEGAERQLVSTGDAAVIEPGTLALVKPEDGARYLRALPGNFAGSTYVSAVLVED